MDRISADADADADADACDLSAASAPRRVLGKAERWLPPKFRVYDFALVVVAAFFVALPQPARAAEVIEHFHSDIRINADATLTVTETIQVVAENKKIRRGIYRDFPTRYPLFLGFERRVGFDVQSVRHNGVASPWHSQAISNGVRIYIGEKSTTVKPGQHVYELTYVTDQQLGYFDAHDELYWNVTGHDWAFPILATSAVIRLPAGVPSRDVLVDGFTGGPGSTNREFEWRWLAETDMRIDATNQLPAGHGLTVVARFPKGYVAAPAPAWQRLIAQNLPECILIFGWLLILLYFSACWLMVGNDKRDRVLAPLYAPPDGVSPAAARYVSKMGYDERATSSALVNLAVMNRITIAESDGNFSKKFSITRLPDTESPNQHALTRGEQELLNELNPDETFEMSSANHERFRRMRDKHEKAVASEYEREYFITNRRWFFGGVGIAIVSVLASIRFAMIGGGSSPADFIFGIVFCAFIGLFVVNLMKGVLRALRSGQIIAMFGVVPMVLMTIYFVSSFLMSVPVQNYIVLIAMLTMAATLLLFYELLKAPTHLGRRLLRDIDGFRLYLAVAEKDELAMRSAPQKTPELFEKYLPYAIALDVETAWSKRFESVLAAADRAAQGANRPRPMHWYSGRSGNIGNAAAGLGAGLVSATASASSPPGSSSGGGGGGFSGGGGGGGGGGGW